MVAVVLFVVALVLAFALRLPGLDERPMHTDEAILGIKFGGLLENGEWKYDPKDYHGPVHPYATLAFVGGVQGKRTIADVTEHDLRIIPLLFGIALIVFLPLISDGIGRVALGISALLMAASPMLVYYSRYYIMEMLFVVFLYGTIACGWRFWITRNLGWLAAAGVCIGLTHATKETCIIHYFAMVVAGAGCWAANLYSAASGLGTVRREKQPPLTWSHAVLLFATAGITSIVFFSAFFADPEGPKQSILTYLNYLGRSEAVHQKPFTYYAGLLAYTKSSAGVWSEGSILALALCGIAVSFFKRPERHQSLHLRRYLSIYALVTFVFYSAISYKTPWTIMGTHHALILLAGVGAAALVDALRGTVGKGLVIALLVAATAHLGYQSVRANSKEWRASEANPFVYNHTSPTLVTRLVKRLDDLATVHPAGKDMPIQVADNEFGWPLQWYLRDRRTVGYQDEIYPNVQTADVIIASPELAEKIDPALLEQFVGDNPCELRPGEVLLVFVRQSLWDSFMETRQ